MADEVPSPETTTESLSFLSESLQLTDAHHNTNSSEDSENLALDLGGLNIVEVDAVMQYISDAYAHLQLEPKIFDILGATCHAQFEDELKLSYIDAAIAYQIHAIQLSHDEDPIKLNRLSLVAISFLDRFRAHSKTSDFDSAIEYLNQAVTISRKLDILVFYPLSILCSAYSARFEKGARLEDLELAITYGTQAVLFTPEEEDEMRETFLEKVADLHADRFKILGELHDIQKAIEWQTRVTSLVGHRPRPNQFSKLGGLHLDRFQCLGELVDIDRAIECYAHGMSLISAGHKDMPEFLNNLGISYSRRLDSLGEMSDLDKAIEFYARAVMLTPPTHKDLSSRLNYLGILYFRRFRHLGKVDDINKSIESHRRAISHVPKGDGDMNVVAWVNNLGNSYQLRFKSLGELDDIEKAIEYHTQAVSLLSEKDVDMPAWLNNLGSSYAYRFGHRGELQDIDKAIECHTRVLSLTLEGHPDMPARLNNLGNSYLSRFERLVELPDIEKAIECHKKAVSLTSIEDAQMFNSLGISYSRRFKFLREPEDINKAIECFKKAVSVTPEGDANLPGRLNNLGASHLRRFASQKELQDVNEAVRHLERAVSLTPEEHADLPTWLNNLGCSYQSRAEHLVDAHDIDKAIECHEKAVSLTPEGHMEMPSRLNELGASFNHLSELTGDKKWANTSAECFRRAAHCLGGYPYPKMEAARQWARLSSTICADLSSLQGYQKAMDLVPELVWLGSTIRKRYENALSIDDLATEAASVAISLGAYDLALEWLEQGRSIVWNQILQLRTPLDHLSSVYPDLAKSLREVAYDLQNTGTQHHAAETMSENSLSLEQVVQQHHRLAEHYQELIKEAQVVPEFKDLLQVKKMPELRRAVQSGPIVVVNVHPNRCDALVLLPGSLDIDCVPLSTFTHKKAIDLRSKLLEELGYLGLYQRNDRRPIQSTPQAKKNFAASLATLWEDVTNPVLTNLGYLTSPSHDQVSLPHITWCTAGPLALLPLHAAGIYNGPTPLHVFDYAVSSYTPTITALIPPTSSSYHSVDKHAGILAIGQQQSQGCPPLPGTVAELACIKQLAGTFKCSLMDGSRATITSVLSAMEKHSWIHLACHAKQDAKNPTESGFRLHDGILSLAMITNKSFQGKDLAFLSACETATGDEKLPDEAIHLAAGMLMAGYRSVIATMWSIKDQDAPLVAEKVYAKLLKDGKLDSTGVARGLHSAVGHLRAKVGEEAFERWVPYIHIGV